MDEVKGKTSQSRHSASFDEIVAKHPRVLLTEREAVELTGYSKHWFRKKRCQGDGPPFMQPGWAVRYDRDELLAWFEQHRKTSTHDSGEVV